MWGFLCGATNLYPECLAEHSKQEWLAHWAKTPPALGKEEGRKVVPGSLTRDGLSCSVLLRAEEPAGTHWEVASVPD